jgi:hypothetical protein
MAELRAVDVVPIDVASKVTLGLQDIVGELRSWPSRARRQWQRAALWVDRQHINPDQVMQLVILVVYGLVAVAEAYAHARKGR